MVQQITGFLEQRRQLRIDQPYQPRRLLPRPIPHQRYDVAPDAALSITGVLKAAQVENEVRNLAGLQFASYARSTCIYVTSAVTLIEIMADSSAASCRLRFPSKLDIAREVAFQRSAGPRNLAGLGSHTPERQPRGR